MKPDIKNEYTAYEWNFTRSATPPDTIVDAAVQKAHWKNHRHAWPPPCFKGLIEPSAQSLSAAVPLPRNPEPSGPPEHGSQRGAALSEGRPPPHMNFNEGPMPPASANEGPPSSIFTESLPGEPRPPRRGSRRSDQDMEAPER